MPPTGHREKPIVNFGNNVSFVPKFRYSPKNEADLLKLLDLHAGGKIRVAGSLHSWSDVVQSEDVIVDMRDFDSLRVEEAADGSVMLEVGAGCTIKKLLSKLHRATDSTLPSLGAITQQTIAGAIATGTHGSGANTLSHYVEELRVAAYDPYMRLSPPLRPGAS